MTKGGNEEIRLIFSLTYLSKTYIFIENKPDATRAYNEAVSKMSTDTFRQKWERKLIFGIHYNWTLCTECGQETAPTKGKKCLFIFSFYYS